MFGASDLVTPALGMILLDFAGNSVNAAPIDEVSDVTKVAVDTIAALGGAVGGDHVISDVVSHIVGGTESIPAIGGDGLDGLRDLTNGIACIDCLGVGDVLAPNGPILDPAGEVADNIVNDFHVLMVGAARQLGEPAASSILALTKFGNAAGFGNLDEDQSGHLVSAILAAPNAALDGNTANAICNIADEIGDTTNAAGTFVNHVVDAVNLSDPLNTGLIRDVAGDLGNGPLLDTDLINVSGEPLLEAVVNSGLSQQGALIDLDLDGDGNPSGSHHLIDLDLGPQGGNEIATLNVLSRTEGSHTAEANVIDVGSDGPRLLDADLFTDRDGDDLRSLVPIAPDLGNIGSIPSADVLKTIGTGAHGLLWL
jgi:hypothetical protein